MGMFDSIYVVDDKTAAKFTCVAGHPQKDVELQTKSLNSEMDDYYLFDDKLYEVEREGRSDVPSRFRSEYVPTGDDLTIHSTTIATGLARTATIICYSTCYTCDPVVYEAELGVFGRIQERSPRVEFEVEIKDGQLVQVTRARTSESREDVRTKLLKQGIEALPDDDRVAKKHLQQLRQQNHRYRTAV